MHLHLANTHLKNSEPLLALRSSSCTNPPAWSLRLSTHAPASRHSRLSGRGFLLPGPGQCFLAQKLQSEGGKPSPLLGSSTHQPHPEGDWLESSVDPQVMRGRGSLRTSPLARKSQETSLLPAVPDLKLPPHTPFEYHT